MSNVSIENHGKVAVVRLDNGVINAISPQLVEDLGQALPAVQKDYGGMVLAGGSKFFSIGFELPTLIQFDRKRLADFLDKFDQLILQLFTLPLPTCCAICGHATAGGLVLAQTCDFRIGTTEKKLLGLNEIKIGLPVPYLADLMLRQLVGDRAATNLLYSGQFISPEEAAPIGLVDAVCPPEEVEKQAIDKVAALSNAPRATFAAVKANRVKQIRSLAEGYRIADDSEFLDCWFSRPVQNLLQAALEKF